MNGKSDCISLASNDILQLNNIACSEGDELGSWIRDKLSSNGDTYGKIAFQGITRKSTANFIRLPLADVDGKFDAVYELITEKWKVEAPRFILSVTGGAKNFDIDKEVLTHFEDIIRKISQIPGAWVISGGTHTGVMKHVGDALREESTAVCVGIPTWGIINSREKLVKQDSSHNGMFRYHVGAWLKGKGAYLNPNHTHFLLVDDGSEGKYGREIKFRAALEKHIVDEHKVPFVLVVLNGGPGTFDTICETIEGDKKVILIKDSGRVADLLSDMVLDDKIGLHSHRKLMNELKKKDGDFDAKWTMCEEKKHLFMIARKEDEQNINDVVIKALLYKSQKGGEMPTDKYLRLALLWHDPFILTKEIPINKPETFSGEVEVSGDTIGNKISFEDLERLLVMSLASGNVSFVKLLLLEYEVDIEELLTMDILQLLYGYQSHEKNFPGTFTEMIGKDYVRSRELEGERKKYIQDIYHYSSNKKFENGSKCILNRKGIDKLRAEFFTSVNDKEHPIKVEPACTVMQRPSSGQESSSGSNEQSLQLIYYPLWELFIWATVCNLPDMAKLLWAFEGDQIAKALVAYKFWGELTKEERYSEQEIESFRENEGIFKSLAYELIDQCYKKDETKAANLITTIVTEHWPNTTCLELAVDLENHDFVAHSCVQNVLTDVWTGKLELKAVTKKEFLKMLIAICIPFFIGRWYKFQSRENVEDNKGDPRSDETGEGDATPKCDRKNIKDFYCNTPVVGFILHFVFAILFLVLYSYVILHGKIHYRVSSLELLLYIVAFGHLTAEIYQITQYDEKTLGKKLLRWVSDKHNRYDTFILIAFMIAVGLRFHEQTRGAAHTVHAVNCGAWILRLSSALRVNSTFGQYLEMVQLMLADLINFLLLLVFTILAYGVLSTSLLYPGGSTSKQLLTVFMRPWFHIYGENFVEMEREANSTHFGTPRYNSYDEYVVWAFMGLYLVLTNILLLNILIAVFNNTYVEVKNKGSKIWKFKRYHLIVEYSKRLNAPSPFSIIPHIYLFLKWIISVCFCRCCPTRCSPTKWSNSELKREIKCEHEKVELCQFECDRAQYIHKYNMDIVNGKVVLKGLETDKTNVAIEELENNMNEIKDIKSTITEIKDSIQTLLEKGENNVCAKSKVEQE